MHWIGVQSLSKLVKKTETPQLCEPLPGEPLTQIKYFFFNRTKKSCRIRRWFEQLSSYSGWRVITKKTSANKLARAVVKGLRRHFLDFVIANLFMILVASISHRHSCSTLFGIRLFSLFCLMALLCSFYHVKFQWWSLETWSRSWDASRDPFFKVSASVSKISGLVSVSVSKDFGLELFISRLCIGYFLWSFARRSSFKKWY